MAFYSASSAGDSTLAWELFRTIAWIVGPLSFIVFIALFGRLPAFRKTPIGWLHRLFLVHVPGGFIKLDTLLTGGRTADAVRSLYHYLMEERHPLVMVMFIFLQSISEFLFLPPASSHLHTWHKVVLLPILIATPYYMLWKSYSVESHHIRPSNYPNALTSYPYDYVLYHPHQNCRTCQFAKPARSKHCPICKACIARHDHHCVWINNCVGAHNYKYFIFLLIAISALLLYGTIMGWRILNALAQEQFVPRRLTAGSLSSKKWSTALNWSEYVNAWSLIIALNVRLGAITLLSTLCLPLSSSFLIYHVYLFYAGMTTNETAKWADLKEDIADGLIWQARISDMEQDYPGPLNPSIVYDADHQRDKKSKRGRLPRWRNPPEYWVIRTKHDQIPLRKRADGSGGDEADPRWVRVKSISDVENIYDLGFWDNAKDMLFMQRSSR